MTQSNEQVLPSRGPNTRQPSENGMISKVPEITLYFWIIKVLCTTVGETISDWLDVNLNLGLTGTSIVMGAVLAVVLCIQFRAKKYIPGIYWSTVVLISVFGTLVTDNLTDRLNVPLERTTIAFGIALALIFVLWYAKEKTLSIHSILTRKREAFYWLAIGVTFALGTAAGDLMAESLGLGYLVSGIISCVVIAAVGVAWKFKLHPVLAFWIAYILTRPLGASLGDYLSQATADGGLGLGPAVTSGVFLSAILATVAYLTVTKKDLDVVRSTDRPAIAGNYAAILQTAIAVAVLAIASGSGYYWRQKQLQAIPVVTSLGSPLGDLSKFRQIAEDTLGLVRKADLSAATSRIRDLESAWDKAEARLKPLKPEKWTVADKSIDKALKKLRFRTPDAGAYRTSLESLIAVFNSLDRGK